MRLMSIVTALLVCVAIYFMIIERERLVQFAGQFGAGEAVEPETMEPTETTVEAEADTDEIKPVSVVAIKSIAKEVTSGIVLRGQTSAFKLLDVKAETSGQVISQPLRKGTLVKKGDTICDLEMGTRGAAIAEAEARLAEAETNNAATAQLVKKGFASETQAKSRLAALEAAQANLERAEREMENLHITAPFTGLLETDSAEFGALLSPGVPCATLIALDPIKLVGFATEQQVARIETGAAAGARLIGGREIQGEVTFISRSADPITRTFRVEVQVPNKDLSIRDGSTADIFIALAGTKGHLIPQSALTLNSDGLLGIRAAVDGAAQFYEIEVIRDTSEGMWVTGLPEETDVIVLGQEFVITGSPVVVTYKGDDA